MKMSVQERRTNLPGHLSWYFPDCIHEILVFKLIGFSLSRLLFYLLA